MTTNHATVDETVRADAPDDEQSRVEDAGRPVAWAVRAWAVVAVLALGLVAASLPGYLRLIGPRPPGAPRVAAPAPFVWALNVVGALASLMAVIICLALAAFLVRRRADDRMALLVSFYLLVYGVVYAGPIERLDALLPGVTVLTNSMQSLLSTTLTIALMVLFPDGRCVPRWTRWVLWGSVPWTVALALAFAPVQQPALSTPLLWLAGGMGAAILGATLYAQLYRYRRIATPTERQQIKVVAFGVAVWLLLQALLSVPFLASFTLPLPWWAPLAGASWWLTLDILPLTLALAVLRYRLWEIDPLINRTLVYGALTASVVGLCVGVVGVLGALVQARGSLLVSLLTTGLIAVLFQPLRAWLQRAVNRLMYGERDEPYTVLARLSGRLEATLSPQAVLPVIVETVAQALKLPYAAIALQQEMETAIVASYGQPRGAPISVPLVYQSAPVGQLILSPRSPSETFSPADHRLLDDLARQVGVAAHAVRLTADLQRSRERLVAAREEERRRLRRDLHDGLGPALAGFTLTVGAARNLLLRDPATADVVLANLGTAIEAAVGDIRRLVYNLRPPALDELGLVGALRNRAAQYSAPSGTAGLVVDVEAPETLPALPAAVEVAAYRIVEEALVNVARHASAQRCQVRLTLAEALCLEITDDGIGLPTKRQAGVGLRSMHERAAELGGTCVVAAAPTGGTRLWARLPLIEE